MLICIMGPTASGKSALAIEIARRVGGEIVSADSMQLYRGLAIGTAQPTEAEQAGVPHHLLGCFPLSEKIDVFRYVELARRAIAEIQSRNRVPVVAGGTGFYIKSLLYELDDLPGDAALRAELDARYDREDAMADLRIRMRELDPAGEARWHDCRRKLIRALEVRLLAGRSILELQSGERRPCYPDVRALKLEWEPAALRERIAQRTDQMLHQGWIEEAERALAAGFLTAPTAHQAIGYAAIGDYLAHRIDAAAMREKIVTSTCQLARRQRTWFRHQHPEATPLAMPDEGILKKSVYFVEND